ncbi:hypothetical protein, partial [Bacteroides sp. An322]|uniref:hypothetical protein n=1 Tax=Bacteroides sp. An322 TaxID=1965632 RepID=UPI00194DD952
RTLVLLLRQAVFPLYTASLVYPKHFKYLMPPKKGETTCKDKEDFALLQIFGKVFYPPPGSPPGFLSESGCKSTAFFRTRKLITHFF